MEEEEKYHFYLTCLLFIIIIFLVYSSINQNIKINKLEEELRIYKLSHAINNYYE